MVEVDPADPGSTPIDHTGPGRFKHENAKVVLASDGRVVVDRGDDDRREFLCHVVSNGTFQPVGSTDGSLDDGTLYVAEFNEGQSGEWLAIKPETRGLDSLAKVLIFARQAGSALRTTTMDRSEWIAAYPYAVEAY